MSEDPFATLLAPGESLVWSAEGQPRPVSWAATLAWASLGAALIVFALPGLRGVFQLVSQMGDFGLRFLGFRSVVGATLPAGLGVIALVMSGLSLRTRPGGRYALSAARAFQFQPDRRQGWASASVVMKGGTVSVIPMGAFYTLAIPIEHSGEDDAQIAFARLRKPDLDAALAQVNMMIGVAAP